MRTVGAFEAKAKLSQILTEVEAGGEVTITRHGQPVAKLVPAMVHDAEASRAGRRALIARIEAAAAAADVQAFDIRAAIEDGRA